MKSMIGASAKMYGQREVHVTRESTNISSPKEEMQIVAFKNLAKETDSNLNSVYVFKRSQKKPFGATVERLSALDRT